MKKDAADEIGKKVLERVGLSEKMKNYPHELSGGRNAFGNFAKIFWKGHSKVKLK